MRSRNVVTPGVLHVQGKLNEAAPLFARALEGREAELGKNHPDTLTSVNNLALLLEDHGMGWQMADGMAT